MRWVREHAGEDGVDVSRIAGHSVSAGGYLAAMAAGSTDSAVGPNALVLWSPGVGDDSVTFDVNAHRYCAKGEGRERPLRSTQLSKPRTPAQPEA
jgi:acetyl esterase/lipase